MTKKRIVYVTPAAKEIQLGSAESLTTGSFGGGHNPALPNPGGDVGDWARRKIFEFGYTCDDSSDPASEE